MRRILGRAAALALIAGLCATIPTAVAKPMASPSRFLRVERTASGMTVKLSDGRAEMVVPAVADLMGRKVVASQGPGFASGSYFLRTSGEALSVSVSK